MTDLELSAIGLGTSGNDDPDTCAETVERALSIGYRHVDTAQMYDNEGAVGEGIRRSDVDREDVTLATKIHPDNLAAEDVVETAHESLDRLGVESVDMLYVHWPIRAYEPTETLPAFEQLHEEGLVEHVCVSNFTPELLDEARDLLSVPIAAHQVECHPYLQQEALRSYAREHGHHLVAYSPLGQGEIFDEPELLEIAERHEVSPAAVCLAWASAQETIVPIPKATGEEHLRANWEAQSLDLEEDDLETIDAIDREIRVVDPDGAPWGR